MTMVSTGIIILHIRRGTIPLGRGALVSSRPIIMVGTAIGIIIITLGCTTTTITIILTGADTILIGEARTTILEVEDLRTGITVVQPLPICVRELLLVVPAPVVRVWVATAAAVLVVRV